jgi:hypothetical protein
LENGLKADRFATIPFQLRPGRPHWLANAQIQSISHPQSASSVRREAQFSMRLLFAMRFFAAGG